MHQQNQEIPIVSHNNITKVIDSYSTYSIHAMLNSTVQHCGVFAVAAQHCPLLAITVWHCSMFTITAQHCPTLNITIL